MKWQLVTIDESLLFCSRVLVFYSYNLLFDLPFKQRLRNFGAFVPGLLSSALSCLYKLGCSRQWGKLNKKTANYKVPMFGCFGAKCDENYANQIFCQTFHQVIRNLKVFV